MHTDSGARGAYGSPAMQAALRLYLPHREAAEDGDGPEAAEDREALPPETRRLLCQARAGDRGTRGKKGKRP